MWNQVYKDQFESLEISLMPATGDATHKTIMEKKVGEKTYELDVSFAIGREEDEDMAVLRQKLQHENFNSDFEPYIPEDRRRELGANEKKLSKMYTDDVIDYVPIKYFINQTFDANTAFIPTKFNVNTKKDKANISIEIADFKQQPSID